ncbi:alpha-E domain-containing protein [Lignipirellula cremea]|uniref:DUF403 domain-containing protein n=1 Tax=Lignipirellula cremea TaxID=2528010 RepID=A0A518DMV2_9BACT|nr:alpha-E domain-containing protein [Lignipirellula cremea]QDU93152.1 hypothetical protein Pla8534_09310 [Lignipirellula cremea]
MLSRVADSVFWMSAYVERAENVARYIDVNYNLTLGYDESLSEQWSPLIFTTGDHELFNKHYPEPSRANVLRFLAFDKENPNSILNCVASARENARTIREIISSVMWEEINKLYFMVKSAAQLPSGIEQPYEFCNRVKLASHLIEGATFSTMSHGEAWNFAHMGRLLERADKTSRIVDVQYYILLPEKHDVGSTLDIVRWSALLKSASALEMYRRVQGTITPAKVADFLILDRYFPRSVRFCLIHVQDSMRAITGSPPGAFCNRAEQRMGRLRSEFDYTSAKDIIDRGLHEFIDDFQLQLNRVGSAIQEDFFTSPTLTTPPPASQWQTQKSQFQSQR